MVEMLIVAQLLGIAYCIYTALFARSQRVLVVGADRVQLIRRLAGESVVLAQVMYSNIRSMAPTTKVYGLRLELWDRNAEGTIDEIGLHCPASDTVGESFVIKLLFAGDREKLSEALGAAILAWGGSDDLG